MSNRKCKRVHIIYVLEDGETYQGGGPPVALAVDDDELDRIVGGEKIYNVVPDWDTRGE